MTARDLDRARAGSSSGGQVPAALVAIGTGASGALVLLAASLATSPLVGAIIVLGLACGAAALVFAPSLVLLAMALVTPLERIGRFGDDLELQTFSVMRLVGFAALVTVAAQMLIRRQKLTLSAPLLLCALLQAQATASIFYAVDPVSTQAHAITMAGSLLMLFTVAQGVRSWRLIEGMALAWLAATIAIGLYQVYDWHFGVSIGDLDIGQTEQRFSTTINALSERATLGETRRAMGTTSNSAVYGINLLLALPFAFYRFRLAPSRLAQLLWGAAIALLLYNLLLTNTRAVLIFMVLLLGVIVATGLFKLTPARIVAGIAGLAVLTPLVPQSIWNRVLNVEAYDLDNATNLQWRFELWSAAVRLGGENWLTGIGVGNRTAIIAYLDSLRFDGAWIMAHNEFLQIFTELGLPGLVTFVAFLGSIIWTAVRVIRRCRGRPELKRPYWFASAALCSLMIAPAFGVQVDVFHFPLKGWWLVAGLILVLDRLTAEELMSPRAAPLARENQYAA